MDGWMDGWTDGDSHTERRSRALCSSPGSHTFSCDAGLSLRPIPARTQSSVRTERSLSCSCCSFALHSIGSRYPRVAPAAAAHTAPCLTLILFSSLYRHAAAVQGRISGAAALRPGRGWRPAGWSAVRVRGSTVVHFGQLRAAVARLRGMCVGMASVGQRHIEGAGGAGGIKARAMGVGLPIRTFKIIAHAIYHLIDGTTRTSSQQHDVSV